MKPADIKKIVLERTKYSDAMITNSEVATHMNYVITLLNSYINNRNMNYFLETLYMDLVANQRRYQLNDLGRAIFKIRNVYANLKKDITDDDNWVRLQPLYRPIGIDDDNTEKIEKYFTNEEGVASYEKRGDEIFIYSGSFVNATHGLKIEYFTKFKKIDTDNVSGNWDEDLSVSSVLGKGIPERFHVIIADAVSYMLKMAGDKAMPLMDNEQIWDSRLREEALSLFEDIQGNVPYRQVPTIDV